MSLIDWEGAKFDRGYQFFDGINKHQKNIINDFVGKDFLHDFGYGAASLTNNKVYSGHALPYWQYKGNLFTLKKFIDYLLKFLNEEFNNNAVFPGLGKRISRAFFLYNVENIVNNYE